AIDHDVSSLYNKRSNARSDATIRDSITEQVWPARAVHGVVSVPGDKSISHCYAMLASIAEGDSQIYNYSTGGDCQSTLSCMQALGVTCEFAGKDGRASAQHSWKRYARPEVHTRAPR